MLMFLGRDFLVDDPEVLKKILFLQKQRSSDHGGSLNEVVEKTLPGFRDAYYQARSSVEAQGAKTKFLVLQGGVLRAYSDCPWNGDGLVIGDPIFWRLPMVDPEGVEPSLSCMPSRCVPVTP